MEVQLKSTHRPVNTSLAEDKLTGDSSNAANVYHHLFDSMPLYVSIFRPDGAILFANRPLAGVTGLTPAQLTERNFYEFLSEPDAALVKAKLAALSPQSPSETHEQPYVNSDGTLSWQEWTNTAFFDENGQLSHFHAFGQDITARKQAEMDLKAAYVKLEALWSVTSLEQANIKTISDHILATIARMTGSAYGFYGFINEDETVMTIHSWSGEAMKDCSMVNKPQHYPISEAGVWAEAIRRRETFILNHYQDAYPAKKGLPEGHVPLTNLLVVPFFSHHKITAVAAVANRATPYGADDVSQITAFLASIQTIVESKRIEEALRESEERFSNAFEYAPIGVALVALDGRWLKVNRAVCEILGYSKTEIQTKTFQELTHPDDLEADLENVQQILSSKIQAYQMEKRYFHKSRQVIYALLSVSLVRDEQGSPLYFVSQIQDITTRKQAEMQIHEQLDELRRWQAITLGRESRILELKLEINQLLTEAGKPPRYSSVEGMESR